MAQCQGNIANDHCCWINGVQCQYLENRPAEERKWVCTLLEAAGSWEAVYEMDNYKLNVKPELQAAGIDVDCGQWPRSGEVCAVCKIVG